MRFYPARDTRLPGPPIQNIEHLLLQIDGNDAAPLTHAPRHRNGKETHAAAEIKHRRTGLDIGVEDLIRIMNPASEAMIDKVATPTRAYKRRLS